MEGKVQGKWYGVYISEDFDVRELNPEDSFEGIVNQVREPLQKANLLEENVETLLTAAFQHVFRDLDLMLIARERPLFQIADLIAIDKIGRLTVFEIKRDKPNSVEIVAQATGYLVDCANLTPVEIKRIFRDYYLRFSVSQVLNFVGLLARRRVESGDSLKNYLKNYLPEDERKKLERLPDKGGDEYFNHLKDISVEHILRPRGVDIESVCERSLRQVTGINDISISELNESTVDFNRMFERRFKINAEKVILNRRWRIVFFAPTYSFSHEIQQYLTWMYMRGMDMLFYEYRIMASSRNGPWLLGWRERRDWLDEKLLEEEASKSFKQWKAIEGELNEFAIRTASEGYVLKKMAGCYESWSVIKPDLETVSVEWPNREANDLSKGKISIKGISHADYLAISNKLGAILNRYNVKITFQNKNHMVINWNAASVSPKDCVEAASRVVVEVLEAIKTSLINQQGRTQ